MFILLIITVPIFYIIGLASFVIWLLRFFGKSRENQESTNLLELLKNQVKHRPNQKISEFLEEYKSTKQVDIFDEKAGESELKVSPPSKESSERTSSADQDLEKWWSNWYSNNSINLLLYVGAFLIVASASIFVGFQWETIAGVMKASVITGCTLAFLGFGVWFYYIPKIRNAGVTFTAIAALLIPFVGYGWYNFVLKDSGVEFGTVWFVTSIASLMAYLGLALWQKNKFYAYTSALGVFSMMLSLVNVYGLDNKFYIVSGILSTFLLLGSRLLLNLAPDEKARNFTQPFEISENILLPLTLIFGISTALSENMIFSLEATVSLFLTAVYYFLSYILTKRPIHLTLAALLFPITIAVFYNWQHLRGEYLGYILNLVAFCYLGFGYVFSKNQKSEETDINIILSLLLTVIIFITAVFNGVSPLDRLLFSLCPLLIGAVCAWIKKNSYFLGVSSVFIGIAGYITINSYLNLENAREMTSIYFLVLAAVFYTGSLRFRDREKVLAVGIPSVVIYSAAAVILVFDKQLNLIFEGLFLAGLSLAGAFQFGKKDLIYLSNFLLNLTLLNSLFYWKVEYMFYPFFFSGLGLTLYFISFLLSEEFGKRYRNSGFVEMLISPLIFGLGSGSSYSQDAVAETAEKNSLICAYLASGVAILEAFRSKESTMAYFASAVAMATILWQIKILGFSDTQFYAIPLGLYFFGLAYSRKIKNDDQNRRFWDLVGQAVWLLPAVFQAFDAQGAKYALILGIEGIILLGAGISMQYKVFMYGGISAIVLAVISQTYNYLFSLPRWMITGIAGLVFLIVAITLLLRRKDISKD